MARASYCNGCGSHNPHGVNKCDTCGCPSTPPVRGNPVTSAEFANTKLVIFDIDRTILDTTERHRSAVRAGVQPKDFDHTTFTQMPKKEQNKREAFMYREDMLAKDQVMPNAMPLIEHLMKQGYTIAYCTGRAFKHYEKTKAQLESKGFPLFSDPTGKTLLFLRKSSAESKGPYKAGVVRTLMAQYDVEFVFDDTIEVLQEAAKLGVPGVYPSIDLYWSMISPRSNPRSNSAWGPKVHQGRDGPFVTGTKNIETAYKALPDLDDPDGKTVGETSYEPKEVGGQKTLGDFENPANPKKIIIKLKNKTQSDKVNKLRKELTKKGIEFDSDIDGGKYPKVRTWFLDFSLKGGTAKQVIAQLKKAKIPHKVEQVKSNPSCPCKDLDGNSIYDTFLTDYAPCDCPPNCKECKGCADNLAGSPISNPANPSKVSKGKKLYKHMNGKDPAKVEKKMIDIGDVWYQVGEGGCWQIGYMSGKETGSSTQKYIHNFNEESKDGNVPKLYATMPDSGKPMLIIIGGTWKIKCDKDNVAWIYD